MKPTTWTQTGMRTWPMDGTPSDDDVAQAVEVISDLIESAAHHQFGPSDGDHALRILQAAIENKEATV